MRDGLLCREQPWRSANLRVSGKTHVVHGEHKLLVTLSHGLQPNALDGNVALKENGFGCVVGVAIAREGFEFLLDLNEREVPFESVVRSLRQRFAAGCCIVVRRRTSGRKEGYARLFQVEAANESVAIPRNVVGAARYIWHAIKKFRNKSIDLSLVLCLADDCDIQLLRRKRTLVIRPVLFDPSLIAVVFAAAAWVKDKRRLR